MELSKAHSRSEPSVAKIFAADSSLFGTFITKQRTICRSQVFSAGRDRKQAYGFKGSFDRISEVVCEISEQREEISEKVPGRNDTVKSLLQESHFRQKLHVERKIIREMVNHSSRFATKQRSTLYNGTHTNARPRSTLASFSRFDSVSSFDEYSDCATAEETGPQLSKSTDGRNKREKEELKEISLKHDRERFPSQRYAPSLQYGGSESQTEWSHRSCYWLTCCYRRAQEDDGIVATIRQTGTLPRLRGKLYAKIYTEPASKAFRILLAESQNDTSFKSHELFIPAQSGKEILGKNLVFKLFDQKYVFSRTCIGEWKIALNCASDVAKIECKKLFVDEKRN